MIGLGAAGLLSIGIGFIFALAGKNTSTADKVQIDDSHYSPTNTETLTTQHFDPARSHHHYPSDENNIHKKDTSTNSIKI